LKNSKAQEKTNYSKYLFAGVAVAAIVLIMLSLSENDSVPVEKKVIHVWSAETDSMFVKNCYEKYKPQVKDDMVKQETMKAFCRCMLEKVKSKYDEKDLDKVQDSDIKKWDTECRKEISNSGFLK
jgi:predicted small secreted protein